MRTHVAPAVNEAKGSIAKAAGPHVVLLENRGGANGAYGMVSTAKVLSTAVVKSVLDF